MDDNLAPSGVARASALWTDARKGVRAWAILLLIALAASAEDPIDVLRERIDDGDPDVREECIAVLDKDPTEMRAWVELFRRAVAPRDQDLLDRAERVRASWERRARGKTGPMVASALALLLVKGVEVHGGTYTVVIGPGGGQGFTSPALSAAESLVRRAERFAPADPWVVHARFLLDRAGWRGEDAPGRIASLAAPVFAALEKDPDNIVLLEALSLLPESPEQERAKERLLEVAAGAHPRLLPGFRMAGVSYKGGRTDVDALQRVFHETPRESLYLDDMAFRLAEAFHHQRGDPGAARRWYDEAIALDRGNCLGPASLAYADLLVDEFDEPARAVDLLRAYREKGLGTRSDPMFATAPGRVLFRIGEIQRSRLAAPREAAESFLAGLAEARAGGRDDEAYDYYYLAAGDCLAEAGDHRGAMSLYGQFQARSDTPMPELWGRWMASYVRVSPYFTISMGFTVLLTALSGVLAIVVLVSQWSRARRYLVAAAVLTLLVGGTQVIVHGWALGVPKADLVWTGLLSARTFLVVPAGMALAAAVGIRTPRARRAARSIAAGVVAGLVMGALTWAFLAWKTPRPSDLLEFLWDPLREGELGAILEPSRHPVAAVLLVMTAGVVEELTCRLFFLGLLVRSLRAVPGRWAISVFLVSFFWAIAHAGMVEPESWKLAQVFTLGIVLGVLARREGILACIVAHALFNAVGVWV